MLIASIDFASSVLSCFDIALPILSYLGGVSILTIAFLYITSYVFKFCSWHRMFIHYILVSDIISYIDYVYGIPIGYKGMLVFQFILAGVTLFLVVYLKFKVCKR